jgi:hypothetical protein
VVLEVKTNSREVHNRLDASVSQLLGIAYHDVSGLSKAEYNISYQCQIAGELEVMIRYLQIR